MNRARVWTNSFTMAEHVQQEAIAREGPLYSEELFHLLRTVIQGEALSHAMQFAQRLRDTADEELVAPLGNFVAAAYSEPDLAQELDRADEAVEAEVDEETPSPSQQRQLLRAHVNQGTQQLENSVVPRDTAAADGVLSNGENVIPNPWSAKHDRCRELGRQQLCRNVTVSIKFVASTLEVRNPLDQENPIRISHVICHGTRYHQGARRQDMTATETISKLRQFCLKHYDAMEVFIMDKGTEFGADFQHLCQSRGILPVVTDLETPWQNSVVERHGAMFKMAFEKACSLEAPTTEAEVNELIDFTFAKLNRRVRRAGFSPSQRVFGRQLRLPSSLLEDDFIDPYTTHEMRRSEAMRMAAAHGCVVAADRRAMSTASHSRQRKPQRVLCGRRTRLRTHTEGWSPRMVWTWRVRPE